MSGSTNMQVRCLETAVDWAGYFAPNQGCHKRKEKSGFTEKGNGSAFNSLGPDAITALDQSLKKGYVKGSSRLPCIESTPRRMIDLGPGDSFARGREPPEKKRRGYM